MRTALFNIYKCTLFTTEDVYALRRIFTINTDMSLNSSNHLVFVMEKQCFPCEVRAALLNII
jgi:hypothetical protein